MGKEFGTGGGVAGGELKDEIGTVKERHTGTVIFMGHRGGTALDEVATHDDNGVVSSGDLPGFGQQVAVAVMEGVKFSDNGNGFQWKSPCMYA